MQTLPIMVQLKKGGAAPKTSYNPAIRANFVEGIFPSVNGKTASLLIATYFANDILSALSGMGGGRISAMWTLPLEVVAKLAKHLGIAFNGIEPIAFTEKLASCRALYGFIIGGVTIDKTLEPTVIRKFDGNINISPVDGEISNLQFNKNGFLIIGGALVVEQNEICMSGEINEDNDLTYTQAIEKYANAVEGVAMYLPFDQLVNVQQFLAKEYVKTTKLADGTSLIVYGKCTAAANFAATLPAVVAETVIVPPVVVLDEAGNPIP